MKTAISIPDDVFARIEQRASALHLNRSQFFVHAAERYLAELDGESLTAQIDAVIFREQTALDSSDLTAAGLAQLESLTTDDSW